MTSAQRTHTTEIWAQLRISRKDSDRIRAFFLSVVGVGEQFITRNPHITVYHARRPVPGLTPCLEPAAIALYAEDTRFMVLAPGGENPRPELDPARRKVGVRVKRGTVTRTQIDAYRDRLLLFETPAVLGSRKPSTSKANAFGARHFQPHVTLLQAGSGVDRDLTKIGAAFRAHFGSFKIDRFQVNIHHVDERVDTV